MAFLTACVIPPTLSVGTEDAAPNSPPAIIAVRSDVEELPEPGPVTFDVGTTAGSLKIDLLDTDVNDALFVRIFVDYNNPDQLPPRTTCPAPASGNERRSATCNLTGLCVSQDTAKDSLLMTIVVFDREPLESVAPLYKALPAGGLSTERAYLLKCIVGAAN
ncbi:MAG: hypothetical protein NT062_15065 [Proteobacteria bacterium]|nr:hypothetical protein [Pseudomonadota bacterium]